MLKRILKFFGIVIFVLCCLCTCGGCLYVNSLVPKWYCEYEIVYSDSIISYQDTILGRRGEYSPLTVKCYDNQYYITPTSSFKEFLDNTVHIQSKNGNPIESYQPIRITKQIQIKE